MPIDESMKMKTGILCGLVLAAGFAFADSGLVIAGRGDSPVATIVLPANASPVQRYAAEELRDFAKKMTGCREMKIVDDTVSLPPRAVLIGNTRHTAALLNEPGFNAEKLGDDGYRLVARPPHLLVLGDGMHSSLFGVYGLLEDYAGCEWFSMAFSLIPSRDRFSVPANLDDTQIPAFAIRDTRAWDTNHDPDFVARLRLHGPDASRGFTAKHGGSRLLFDEWLVSAHSLDRLLPVKEFFPTHPEYFSEINGIREPCQPCLSNRDVRRIVKERLLARIASQYPKGGRYFSVGQYDNGNYCRCAKCSSLDEREGSPSASIVDFLNEMADAVADKYPDALLRTLAYMYSVKAPKTLRLRPNVQVVLCADQTDHFRPFNESEHAGSRKFADALMQWKSAASQLRVWDYSVNFALFPQPFPNFRALHGNFLFLRDNGVANVFEQGCTHSPYANLGALRLWTIAHLMWNPDQPLDRLVDRFMRGYYGAAAPHMRRYFDEMHAIPFKTNVRSLHMWWTASPFDITEDFLESSARHLRRAADAVADDPARLRHVGLDIAMNDVMRILRDNVGAPVEVSRHPEYVNGARFAELRKAARTYLELAKGLPDLMRIGEAKTSCTLWDMKVRHLATMDPARVAGADRAFVPPSLFLYSTKDDKVRLVDDVDATTGKALCLSPKANKTSVAFYMNCAHFDRGGTYRVRVRVKVKLVPGAQGDVFRCCRRSFRMAHLYEEDMAGMTVPAAATSSEFKWYDAVEPWKPDVTDSVCFGCADWDAKKTNFNPNVEAIWLDGIELIRVD